MESETPNASPHPLPPEPRRPSFRRALAHRPFLLLWSSQLVSQSGDFVFEVALLWLVLQATGSAFAVGLVVTATLVPAVVLGPFLGVYVDRWPRRALLLGTNLVEGLLVAGLSGAVLAHVAGLPVILGIVVALATGAQIVRISSNALVPQTVGTDDLAPANGLLSFSNSFTQIVGLSVGGVVVALFGVTLPIEYDALSFFVAAALVALLPRTVGRPEPAPPGQAPRFREQFVEGVRYVRQQRFLVEAILLGIVVNFFGNAIGALFAPYADYVLHGGAVAYGLLGATVAGGSIVGALAAGKIDARRHAGHFLFGGSFGIGGTIVALGLTSNVYLAWAIGFALGAFLALTNVPIFTVIQAKVPGRLMGRVMSVLFSLIVLSGPFGSFFAGTFAEASSVGTVFLVSGLVILAVESVGVLVMRELRDVRF